MTASKIKIDKVVFTITNIDDENAGVHVETFPPLPDNIEEMEETPAYELAASLWNQLHEGYDAEQPTLQ